MMKWVEWHEPLWGKDGEILGDSIVRSPRRDVIKWYRYQHPDMWSLSDDAILDYFMVNYWAWIKEYPDETTT